MVTYGEVYKECRELNIRLAEGFRVERMRDLIEEVYELFLAK